MAPTQPEALASRSPARPSFRSPLVERLRAELFPEVVIAYGLTESCGTVTVGDRHADAEAIARTVGRPIEGIVGGFNVYPAEVEQLIARNPRCPRPQLSACPMTGLARCAARV
jgi:acyl-CoA synthetase (AMP-forming)/AMP-acid ligase II